MYNPDVHATLGTRHRKRRPHSAKKQNQTPQDVKLKLTSQTNSQEYLITHITPQTLLHARSEACIYIPSVWRTITVVLNCMAHLIVAA